jgi:hypothetical protein
MWEHETVRLGEWLTIAAAIIGPVLAVQAQKWVERDTAKQSMKDSIFRTLMATRGARLSQPHVEALNMIPIAFYGRRYFGHQWQNAAEKRVSTAWREYFANLGVSLENFSESQRDVLFNERNDKFINLLHMIAIAQRYDFEPLDLRNGYTPNHHTTVDAESEAIRAGLAQILSGHAPLPMKIVEWPGVQAQADHVENA